MDPSFHENLQKDFDKMNSLLVDTKNNTKEYYKFVKNVKTIDDQNKLNENIETLIKQLNKINETSANFNEILVSKDYLNSLSTNSNDELDDTVFKQFIYGNQMIRGKVKNLELLGNLLDD